MLWSHYCTDIRIEAELQVGQVRERSGVVVCVHTESVLDDVGQTLNKIGLGLCAGGWDTALDYQTSDMEQARNW